MTVLTIGCIIILMIVALNFIWESWKARQEWSGLAKFWHDSCCDVEIENLLLKYELSKYKRPRDAQGRFIKDGS